MDESQDFRSKSKQRKKHQYRSGQAKTNHVRRGYIHMLLKESTAQMEEYGTPTWISLDFFKDFPKTIHHHLDEIGRVSGR